MAEELIVPKLGMAAAVVTLTEWKVAEGARIEKGDTVLDIEAEKSVFEMPAPISGYLHILVGQGEETDVNTLVGLIAASQEEYAVLRQGSPQDEPPVLPGAQSIEDKAPAQTETIERARIFITPIARRIAAEHQIDIAAVAGSGPHGRIQRDDISRAIEARKAKAAEPVARPNQPAPAVAADTATVDGRAVREVIPYRGMRKVIGENMMRSLAVNAPNTMSGDFDLTVMARYRDNFVQNEGRIGTRITYADLMIYAVAKALRQFPFINSSLVDKEIRVWDDINIGMAVALGNHGEKGLVVPVIKAADKKSLVEISKTAKSLGEKARADKLTAEDMTGGTFTVSNFGSLGVSSYSTPIINTPESAIIGIGRLQKKPIVRNDGIMIAPMLPYSLTHDHRVIDGAAAEHFLGILKGLVESKSAELNELILF